MQPNTLSFQQCLEMEDSEIAEALKDLVTGDESWNEINWRRLVTAWIVNQIEGQPS